MSLFPKELRGVIATLLSSSSSPAKAKWGKEEWEAWRALTKGKYHIGMELEYIAGITYNNAIKSTGLAHSRGSLASYKDGEQECVQLFPLSSPNDFTSSVSRFLAVCAKHKIPTLGSVHLNILRYWGDDSFGRKSETSSHSDFCFNVMGKSLYRSENKYYSGFILKEDLMAQMILFLGAYTLCKNGYEYGILLDLVKDCYPVNLKDHWARIDLTKVLD